jgi:hypothetical protein
MYRARTGFFATPIPTVTRQTRQPCILLKVPSRILEYTVSQGLKLGDIWRVTSSRLNRARVCRILGYRPLRI